jgi:hypothetical protein
MILGGFLLRDFGGNPPLSYGKFHHAFGRALPPKYNIVVVYISA